MALPPGHISDPTPRHRLSSGLLDSVGCQGLVHRLVAAAVKLRSEVSFVAIQEQGGEGVCVGNCLASCYNSC